MHEKKQYAYNSSQTFLSLIKPILEYVACVILGTFFREHFLTTYLCSYMSLYILVFTYQSLFLSHSISLPGVEFL